MAADKKNTPETGPEVEKSENTEAIWQRCLPLLQPDILTATLGINLLSLALPLVVLQVYDRIIPYAALPTLSLLVLGLSAVLILDVILKSARSYLAGWAGARFEHEAGVKAVRKLLGGDLRQVEATPAGVHLDRLSSVEPVREFYASQASLALVDLPFVVLFLGLLTYIAGSLVLVPIVLLLVFGGLAVGIGVQLRGALTNRATWDDRRYNFVIEVLSGIHSIKSLAMERLMLRRHERLMESCAKAGFRVAFLSNLAQGLGSALSQITMAVVAAAGSLYVISGQLSIGALAACTLLAGRAVQPVLRALGLWTRFQAIRIAEERLAELDALDSEQVSTGTSIEKIGGIELEKVSFSYAPDSEKVLNEISLRIEPGEMIGIRGGNGVGKTTLLWLLMGGLMPTNGRLRINGQDISELDLAALREKIAYLPQQAILFEGTAMDNITMFRGDGYLTQANELAARLGLDQAFAKMPDGYETKVGSTASSNLPGGVAQRIAVARAMMGAPELILFDEANTALDGPADARLTDLLMSHKGKATMIVVSYRPSLLRLADRRFDLAGGKLHPVVDQAPQQARPAIEKQKPEAAEEQKVPEEAL